MDFNKINLSAVVAELVGTFTLTIAVLASINGGLAPIPTAMVAGATLGILAMGIGGISGAHVNPAVTLGLASIKKIDMGNAIGYIVAQIVGALAALATMNYFFDTLTVAPTPSTDFTTAVLMAEILGAAVFTFGVAAAVLNKASGAYAGLLVGGSLMLGAMLAGTAASNGILNPAVAGGLESLSLEYILGPIIGSILGMGLYSFIFAGDMTMSDKSKKSSKKK